MLAPPRSVISRLAGLSRSMLRGAGLPLATLQLGQPVAAADLVTLACSSGGERQHCAADTGAGVLLQQTTGESSCVLGRSWGYDAQGIWVTEGCSGEFLVRRAATDPEAQAASATAEDGDATTRGFSVYTRFTGIVAYRDGGAEVQDNGSRVRFGYSTGKNVRLFALGEWNMNLTGSGIDFNPGESTSGGFFVLDAASDSPFGSRLGYIGADFGKSGTLTLGKQWGVHYDVARYTDAFNVFGAEASATFNASTDGGFMGTGRADQALIYRRSLFERVEIGAQAQFRESDETELVDGYGLSLRARLMPALEAGVSFTHVNFADSLKGTLLGLDGDGDYRIAGLRYTGEALTLAVIYAEQRNGDLVRIPLQEDGQIVPVPEVFDANGVELFARYRIGSLGFLVGYNDYKRIAKDTAVLINRRALRRYFIAGLDYAPTPQSLIYAEFRLASGYDVLGVPGEDVVVIGAKYEFSLDGLMD